MKKNLSRLAVGAACVLAVFGLFKTASLKQEISRLQSDLNNQIRALNNSIDAIYDNVDAMLEEQNNLFSVSNWAYGDIDVEAKTTEVVCTIVPKAYTPGVTQAVMVCGGQEYPMSYADNRYTATLSLPLFEPAGDWQVRLADNGLPAHPAARLVSRPQIRSSALPAGLHSGHLHRAPGGKRV